MAGNRRKNKCKRGSGAAGEEQPWFKKQVARNRVRNKIAKKSRQKNWK